MSIHPAAVRPARVTRSARRQSSSIRTSPLSDSNPTSPRASSSVFPRARATRARPRSRAMSTRNHANHRSVPARWVNPPPNASPGRLSSSPPSSRTPPVDDDDAPALRARVLTDASSRSKRRTKFPRIDRTAPRDGRTLARARFDATTCEGETPDRGRSIDVEDARVSARRRRPNAMYARRSMRDAMGDASRARAGGMRDARAREGGATRPDSTGPSSTRTNERTTTDDDDGARFLPPSAAGLTSRRTTNRSIISWSARRSACPSAKSLSRRTRRARRGSRATRRGRRTARCDATRCERERVGVGDV